MPKKEYFLYRHFDENGVLLYVGISPSRFIRLSQHKDHSYWFSQIKSVTFAGPFSTKEEALEEERKAIRKEAPKFNIHGKKTEKQIKAEIKEEERKNATLLQQRESSQKEIVKRLVVYKPVYKLNEVAFILRASTSQIRRYIEDFGIPTFRIGRSQLLMTGWSLITFIEMLENGEEINDSAA